MSDERRPPRVFALLVYGFVLVMLALLCAQSARADGGFWSSTCGGGGPTRAAAVTACLALSGTGATLGDGGLIIDTPNVAAHAIIINPQGAYGGTAYFNCVGTCTDDTPGGGSTTPPGAIALDSSQVGFWTVCCASALMFALGFIGGRMR